MDDGRQVMAKAHIDFHLTMGQKSMTILLKATLANDNSPQTVFFYVDVVDRTPVETNLIMYCYIVTFSFSRNLCFVFFFKIQVEYTIDKCFL